MRLTSPRNDKNLTGSSAYAKNLRKKKIWTADKWRENKEKESLILSDRKGLTKLFSNERTNDQHGVSPGIFKLRID